MSATSAVYTYTGCVSVRFCCTYLRLMWYTSDETFADIRLLVPIYYNVLVYYILFSILYITVLIVLNIITPNTAHIYVKSVTR